METSSMSESLVVAFGGIFRRILEQVAEFVGEAPFFYFFLWGRSAWSD
jgi:hypothetical protein